MRTAIVAMVVAATAALMPAAAPAGAAKSTFVPSTGTFFDFCTGELIELDGINHFVVSTTEVPGGGIHQVMHLNALNFHGTGLVTGTRYTAVGANNSALKFDMPQGATTTEVSVHLRLLSDGPGADIFLDSLYHVTVTPNGDVTADVDTFETSCH